MRTCILQCIALLMPLMLACSDSGFDGAGKITPRSESGKTTALTEPEDDGKPAFDGTPQSPREGCQAFFSGAAIGGRVYDGDFSKIYSVDYASEWVGEGNYASSEKAFPKSVDSTFDGIAFDKGTRVTIYKLPDYQGAILFSETGPYVVNNVLWRGKPLRTGESYTYTDVFMGNWGGELQSKFPKSVRHWSQTNMHTWSFGSVKVECGR